MTYKLVLLRHGQSAWNKTNQFTGWVDVPLTEQGEAEAKRGGELLKEKNVLPDIVFTSLLRRAINTANIALDAADRLWISVQRDWRLNERLQADQAAWRVPGPGGCCCRCRRCRRSGPEVSLSR